MPGTALVSRRHVDLLRTASAQCRPEEPPTSR
ncbi:putative leader peptide [Modestobacter sp. NPDC049651]